MIIERVWSMPSRHTFQIRPIAKLIKRIVGNGIGWIDPFAGYNSPAEFTNDLNPSTPARYHIEAKDFVSQFNGDYKFKGVLFDPPYSLRQLKECYENFGGQMTHEDSMRFPQNIKEIVAELIKPDGYAITFGWNSQGFGKNLGFEITEILLVPHGRSHNDTIVVVEKKITPITNPKK